MQLLCLNTIPCELILWDCFKQVTFSCGLIWWVVLNEPLKFRKN